MRKSGLALVAVCAATFLCPLSAYSQAPTFPPVSPIVYPADNPSLGVVVPLTFECQADGSCGEQGAIPTTPVPGNVVLAGRRQYCYDGSGPLCFPVRATYTYSDGREVPLLVGVTDGTSLLDDYKVVSGPPSAQVRWPGESRPYYESFETGPVSWLEGQGTVQGLCVWSPEQNGHFPYPPGSVTIGLRDPLDAQHIWYGTVHLAGFMPLCSSEAWTQYRDELCDVQNCYPYPTPGCPVIDHPFVNGLSGHCPSVSPPCPNNPLCPPTLDSSRPGALVTTPESGPAPLEVTASIVLPVTGQGRYYFDFGDDSPIVGPQQSTTASHTYSSAGSYTVTVTASATEFWTDSATVTVGESSLARTAAIADRRADAQRTFLGRSARKSKTKFAWGQLWRARDTVTVRRNGHLVKRVDIGIRPRGYNAWRWRHSKLRPGRYVVRVCGQGSGYRHCRTLRTFRRS